MPNSTGLDAVIKSSIIMDGQKQQQNQTTDDVDVCLCPPTPASADPSKSGDACVDVELPVHIRDGYMVLKLGQFSVEDDTNTSDKQVTLILMDPYYTLHEKTGLIISGITTYRHSFFLSSRTLQLGSDNPQESLHYVRQQYSRFKEVAELQQVRQLKIEVMVSQSSLRYLSPLISCAAYLIFKIEPYSKGLKNELQVVTVSTVTTKDRHEVLKKTVCLHPIDVASQVELPAMRLDGWMELLLIRNLEKFVDNDLKMSLEDINKGDIKFGLSVAGIEVRPIQAS